LAKGELRRRGLARRKKEREEEEEDYTILGLWEHIGKI
jgi:hypothetical protein